MQHPWFISIMLLALSIPTHHQQIPKECTKIRAAQETIGEAYYGWPFRVFCSYAFLSPEFRSSLLFNCNSNDKEWDYVTYDECNVDDVLLQCIVISGNRTILFNASSTYNSWYENPDDFGYNTDDVRASNLHYTLVVANSKLSKCVAVEYNVDVVVSDCPSSETQPFSLLLGGSRNATCQARIFENDLFYFSDVTYRWLYMCSPNFTPTYKVTNISNQLRIEKAGFEHAGVYTCEATYKGFKRYLYSYQLCIQYPQPSSQLAITCKKTKLQVSVGEDVEQVCTVYYGKGSLINFGWSVKLRKKTPSASHSTSIDCPQKQTYDINNKTSTISCIQKPTNHCIATAPSLEKQKKKPDAFVEVRIKMKNFNKENYGLYTLAAYSIASNVKRLSKTFEIVPDPTPGLLSQTTAAGIAIGVVSLLLILICAVIYNSLYTRVCFKRFFGRLTKDDKPYGAFLAYNFSHHSMDKFTKNLVQDWIPRIRGSLEELGYHVFDEHKDDWLLQDRADNLWKAIKQCHRVVIFLNHGFVNDDWNSFVIHKGLEAMIQSGCKIVFILPPGIQEYLKQNSGNQTLCRTAERAIKINRFIQLAAKPNMTFLKLALEDAMPKLKKTSLNWDPVTRCCKCKNKEIHEESRQKSDKKTTHNYNNNNNKHFQNV